MEFLLGVVIGAALALMFGGGAGINYALMRRSRLRYIRSFHTSQDHRAEAERLIHESFNVPDDCEERYLRAEALGHFMMADQLDNGPYRS